MKLLDTVQLADERLFFRVFEGKFRLKRWAWHCSRSGDGPLYLLLPTLYWFGYPVQGRTFFLLAFAAFALERCLYSVLKRKLRRRRPPAAIPGFQSLVVPSDEFSFPSGHTSAAFLFATLCCAWFGPVASPLYAWAALVGLSRVLLGVHFVTDIVAGAAMGAAVGYALAGALP